VVHYSECDGNVAWCPLAPEEVRYPSEVSFGFSGNHSWLNFSIGGCAVYYAGGDGYCSPRPWNNRFVNQVTYVNVTNDYYGPVNNHDHYDDDSHFIPKNARYSGVTTVALGDFAGRGDYHREPNDGSNLFRDGRGIGAPDRSDRPFSGPIAVKPTTESITPGRTFFTDRQPTGHDLDRPVFRAPLPTHIQTYAPPIHNFGNDNGNHGMFPANNGNQNNGDQPGGQFTPRHGLGPQDNKQWVDQHGGGNNQNVTQQNNGQQGGNNNQQGGNNGQQNGNNGQQGGNWQHHDVLQPGNDNPPANNGNGSNDNHNTHTYTVRNDRTNNNNTNKGTGKFNGDKKDDKKSNDKPNDNH